ncbi:MAG: hypothetical protein KIS62_06020 [Ramlibacter sp.]|nr:hypothetical protein [Ramlibacter sp.]
MATQSPFPFLDDLLGKLQAGLQPPPWAVEEMHQRMVLLINHVLQQEPEAQARLVRQSGRVLQARWRMFTLRLAATPAGLLELAPEGGQTDLNLTVTEESPWQLAQAALRGDKPPVRIEGDVQFAAEINWLADHVRWDLEEDLSRLIGDAPAHALGQAARGMAQALRSFIGRRTRDAQDIASTPSDAPRAAP